MTEIYSLSPRQADRKNLGKTSRVEKEEREGKTVESTCKCGVVGETDVTQADHQTPGCFHEVVP